MNAQAVVEQIIGTIPLAGVLYLAWREERKDRKETQQALIAALERAHALGESTRDAIQMHTQETAALRAALEQWVAGMITSRN